MSDPRPPRDEDVDAPNDRTATGTPVAAHADTGSVPPAELVEPAAPPAPGSAVPAAVPAPVASDRAVALGATDAAYDDDADTDYEVTPPRPAVAPTALTLPESSRVVYVEAPRPPRAKHNRGFGAVMALLSTVIFAAIYLGLALLVLGARGADAADTVAFALSGVFLVPVGAFALFSVLLALLVNRAPWWVHVLGSLIVGALVYAASIGTLLLLSNVVAMTPDEASRQLAFAFANPIFTIAGLVAREVSLWVGLGIAARGRRVKARNIEAREAFDREQAEARAAQDRLPGAGYPVVP